MEHLGAYLPQDRLRALVSGSPSLPPRCFGAALLADISGFTPLAEALTRSLGPLRGAEEITRHLNDVYTASIAAVDQYRGSVIGFCGDAATCWFQDDDGRRAVAAALVMQEAMRPFASVSLPDGSRASLTLRIGIATGLARRFAVGDPAIQRLDVLAGRTLERMLAAQMAAPKGGIALDPLTAHLLGQLLVVSPPDATAAPSQGGLVVAGLRDPIPPDPWPALDETAIAPERLREWILRPVQARLQEQSGAFLTEMRPTVALFIDFSGLDYDEDPAAGQKLDTFVTWVQRVLAEYEGYLIEVVVGDKGSYLYAAFGAPLAHEDDVWRALMAACILRSPPPEIAGVASVRIGVSRGLARTGAYGSPTRRTYGIQGDEVNVAARLMQAAAPGQVLVSERACRAAESRFAWQSLPPLHLKGKSQPIPVHVLIDPARRPLAGLREPAYALPMVGRARELESLEARIAAVGQGRGAVVSITGDPGLGKSRLIAEAVRLAQARGLAVAVAQGHSHATQAAYAAWTSCWPAIFGLDPAAPAPVQLRQLHASLRDLGEDLLVRLPLLSAVTHLPIPDNEVTAAFDPKLRKASLESLLAECLGRLCRRTPWLLVLEDYHWFDPLSRDLFETLVRSSIERPVLFLLGRRVPPGGSDLTDRLLALPGHAEIRLTSLDTGEAAELVRLKTRGLSPDQPGLPAAVMTRVFALAEGNPFFLEELLSYLHARAQTSPPGTDLSAVELPSSLHALVLSRIDQLSEGEKITAKVASVLGRVFEAATLWGSYPELGPPQAVRRSLDALSQRDVTVLSAEEPELVYLFKHVLTQEAAYASLPQSTRGLIHERVGAFIEANLDSGTPARLDLLAYHYGRSDNGPKKRQYLVEAGKAAQARYANESALDYLQRALPLLDGTARIDLLLRQGQVLELLGRWAEARTAYDHALADATGAIDAAASAARCQLAIAELLRKQAQYADAGPWLDAARTAFLALRDDDGVAQALHYAGTLAAQQGDATAARSHYLASLELRRRLRDKPRIASLLSNLAILAHQYTGNRREARSLYEESLAIRREAGDRWAIANSLNNLGVLHHDEGSLAEARRLLEESVTLNRQVGDRWAIANSLSSLAAVTLDQRDIATSRDLLSESLTINRDLNEPRGLAFVLEYFARLAALEGEIERMLRILGATSALRERIQAPLSPEERQRQESLVGTCSSTLPEPSRTRCWEEGLTLSLEAAIAYALNPP